MFTSITRLTVFWSSTCNRVAVLQSPSQIFFWVSMHLQTLTFFYYSFFFDHEARHLLSCVKITGVTSPWPSFKTGLINLVSLLTYTSNCGNNTFSAIDDLKANEVLCLVWTIRKQDEINYRKLRVKGRGGKQAWWPRTFGWVAWLIVLKCVQTKDGGLPATRSLFILFIWLSHTCNLLVVKSL